MTKLNAKKYSPGLYAAIVAAGGVSALANKIGVWPSNVCNWRHPPPHRVAAIEAATGIPRHELRPDLWIDPAREQEKSV